MTIWLMVGQKAEEIDVFNIVPRNSTDLKYLKWQLREI